MAIAAIMRPRIMMMAMILLTMMIDDDDGDGGDHDNDSIAVDDVCMWIFKIVSLLLG